MDLYQLHNKPHQLKHENKPELKNQVPSLLFNEIYSKYGAYSTEDSLIAALSKYEHIWARDPRTAVDYASLKASPFPKGEDAIATSPQESIKYTRLFRRRVPAAEPKIVQNVEHTITYLHALASGLAHQQFQHTLPPLLADLGRQMIRYAVTRPRRLTRSEIQELEDYFGMFDNAADEQLSNWVSSQLGGHNENAEIVHKLLDKFGHYQK